VSFHHGGLTEVSTGDYLGLLVAIKRLKMNEGDSDGIFKVPLINLAHQHRSTFTQRLCREVVGWKHLTHPNIFPLLGISMSTEPHHLLILSEWMPNGNVMVYAKSNPEANRLRMASLLAISLRPPPPLINHPSSLRSCPVWPTFTGSGSFTVTSKE